ncbi:MAG TPA: phospho-sugar mutase [Smithellaceae bacterium]|nr:phospho-sugar mutase [Smithellaceae bacterium]HRV43662.1 phospho-sugar mutase [Smithellaceae bacterium]
MTYRETYRRWRECVTEPELLAELESIRDDDAQIQDRFHMDLPFGTAGLRGVIGAGIARMNRYVVGRATQGLADYLTGGAVAGASAVIAYDSRKYSFEFARETACVLAANGIRVYLFKQLTSVPELSFAVRHLKASGGVVITASHNPRQYNGYKVYAAYGGQLGPEASLAVMDRIRKLDPFADVKRISYEEGTAKGRILEIGEEIDRIYYDHMIRLCGGESAGDLKVVYTPLHGSGLRTVEKVFPLAGIHNWCVVPEQRMPDGSFPTVASPNPEDPKAMEMAIALAGKMEADLAIGTDPDADRMGAAVRRLDGTYTMLTGNQIGCLLIHYLLEKRRQSGELRASDYLVKSFVSTGMADAIAAQYGIHCYTVLTGFRFISELIVQKEPTGAQFIFGFEESFGFLAGTFALDKDGALAALLLCKAAQFFRVRGQSLPEALEALYREHGYYLESVKNIALKGLDGMEKMKGILEQLRTRPIAAIGGLPVRFKEDYRSRTRTDRDGAVSELELPSTDAIKLTLDSDAWICIRPSGTEPKIKIYYAVHAASREEAQVRLRDMAEDFEQLL